MDRSKAGRAARQPRRWNWRNLLVLAGALGYWISVTGQLGWNMWSALAVEEHEPLQDPDAPSMLPSILSCVCQVFETRRVPSSCSIDLAPYAGLALIAGILSIWWNPKLRLKVEGRGGRFVGLGEYYQVQLIVMVVRCAFWGVLRDPSSSGLPLDLPPTLHLFMIFFTVLVSWSDRVSSINQRANSASVRSGLSTHSALRYPPIGSMDRRHPRAHTKPQNRSVSSTQYKWQTSFFNT